MIFGGSQGAPKINASVVQAIPEFSKRDYQVVFATGQKRYDQVKEALKDVKVGSNVKVVPYIEDMPLKCLRLPAWSQEPVQPRLLRLRHWAFQRF